MLHERCILYLSGGTMRGIFGAGVVTHIQEANLYGKIEAIYGCSAGAIAAAYCLTEQTRLGSSIFWEDLTHDFISVRDFWGGIRDRIVNRYIKNVSDENMRDATDIEYLFDVITQKKVLDVGRIGVLGIPLWVKILDLRTREVKYFNIKDFDPIQLLKASASMVPYIHTPVILNGREYVDASIADQIGIAELRKRHPDRKIVVVFSGDSTFKRESMLKNHIEGMFAHMMYGSPYYALFATAYRKLRDDLRAIKNDNRILLIETPVNSPTLTRTCDPRKILETYKMGIEAGKKIDAFLSN